MKRALSSIVLAVGIALSGYFIGSSINNFHQFDRFVSVKGLSEQNVKANKAIWTLNYSISANKLTSIYTLMKRSQNIIIEFLISAGFNKKNINITSISISSNSQTKGKLKKQYTAYASITLVTNNVESVATSGQHIEDLVQKGVLLTGSNISYRYTNLNSIKPIMLSKAITNAKIAADSFAKNAKANIGSIRKASQGVFTILNADDSYGNTDIMKKVRVVVSLQYFINS